MTHLSEISAPVMPSVENSDSLLIACASYEDRSTHLSASLAEQYRADHTIIFRSSEYALKGNTPSNFACIKLQFDRVSAAPPSLIEFSIDQPISAMREFERQCRELDRSGALQTVTVDMTAFPRQELLVLLRVLDSLASHPSIRLFYAEPCHYDTEHPEGWLTRGVKSVRTVPGFGGVQPPGKKKLLVLFMGHESERAAITWKRHQPNKTIAAMASPSYREDLDQIVQNAHAFLCSKIGDMALCGSVPATGIDETRDYVLHIRESHKDTHYIVVAPLGTKLQMLGIYEAARICRDIQITYAVPAVYNYAAYSEGARRLWEIGWRGE